MELNLKSENEDAAALAAADSYAAKGFFVLAIHEAQKVPETSSLYADATSRIVAWAKRMQEALTSSKDNAVLPVRNAPVLVAKALFTKDTGPLEAFNMGHNNPKLELEFISINKLTVKEVQFKIYCFDALDEPSPVNKGVYLAKADQEFVPLKFQKVKFDLKDMGNVQRVKIKLISVLFADGSAWEAPPEIK